jgi:hypothetical protein
MKNKQNESNNYKCVLCETGEGSQHGALCSCKFMTIKSSERKESCCGDFTQYQLSGWDKDDWMCADCFLNELINNGYQIKPQNI